MKRFFALMFACTMVVALATVTVFAYEPAGADYGYSNDDWDENVTQILDITFFIDGEPTIPIPAREVDGETYLRLRYVAMAAGATVEWDGPSQTVYLTTGGGDVLVIVIAEVGGFNDAGHVWIPMDFALTLLFPAWGWEWDDFPEIEVRDDIEPVQPVVRTTDHGQAAVEFITALNDYFYNRVPFSYQELEAAEWIAYQLLAMGHPEDTVYIQTFAFDDVVGQMGWFAYIAERYNIFDPDERIHLEEVIAAAIASELEMIPYFMEETGMTLDEITYMLADMFDEYFDIPLHGLDIYEVLYEIFSLEFGTGFISDYGVYDPYTTFRPMSQNVLLTIPGQSSHKIVVTAHYDGVLNPGASDNASGVGLLLEGAYRMLGADNYFTIVFAFVGAEEVGYLGAYYYLQSLTPEQQEKIVLNINADVLFEGPYFFFGTAFMGPFGLDNNELTDFINQLAETLNAQYGTALISERSLAQMPSDQIIFLNAGHTVVAFTGLARIGAEDYADFMGRRFNTRLPFTGTVLHTPNDCVHVINEIWPSKIGDAMWTFGLFLEYLLGMR